MIISQTVSTKIILARVHSTPVVPSGCVNLYSVIALFVCDSYAALPAFDRFVRCLLLPLGQAVVNVTKLVWYQ